jgi:hypothetical protein
MTEKQRELQEEFVLEDQQLDEEDQDLLELIYDRLDIFEQMNRPYHEEAKKCRRILHMDDPDQDDPRTWMQNGKKTLQLQTLKSTINNVVADQMLSMPEAKVIPETPERQEEADDVQDILHYITYCANDYEQLHYRRCEDFYCTGTAITQIAWDPDMNYGRGEVALIRWPVEAFLWDPTAERLDDCRAVMKVSWHPQSWFLEHWPEEGKYVGCDSNMHNNVGMSDAQEDAEHQSDEKRALLIEYWWREYNAKTRRYTINVAYAAGNALLEKQTDVYDHGMYPFVIDVHDSIEGSLVGAGLVSELAPMMRYINRYAAYADMNARMSSKGRMLVRRGAGIDKEALTDWQNDVIEGDQITQGDAWNWMQNQPFNATITNLMTMFQSDLKADSGANQFTRGETTGGIVSGKAINSLIQAGGKVASMRTEQLKYGDKNMDEQKLWLASQFYEDGRTIMITGRQSRAVTVDSKKLFGVRGKGKVNPPPYSVQIEVSSRDPQRIANQNQMFMEAYTMSAQAQQFFPLSSLFQILNLDGKDRILPVIQANEHYQEQMQMMQQQLEQMGQQMQQMQQENQNLREAANETANAVAQMGARRGGGAVVNRGGNPGQPMKVAEAGGGPNTSNAVVEQARNMMGVPTGTELPA